MKYFEKFLKIKIEYLELRSIKNLKISNNVKRFTFICCLLY